MATIAELNAKIDTLQTTVDDEQAQISAAIQTLKDANAALQLIIDQGGTVTPADLDAAIAKIDGVITDLSATVEP